MRYFNFILLLIPLCAYPQDAGEIVRKCVDALGGEKALGLYADYKASGNISYFRRGSEMQGKLELIRKGEKSWRKVELDFGGQPIVVKNVYDGANAFSDRNGRVADMPSLNYESDNDHSIALLAKSEATFTLDKESEIDGNKVLGVLVEYRGKSTLFYIDANDFTVKEIVFSDLYFGDNDTKETVEKRVRYGNYKKIDGVRFPTTVTFLEKGMKQFAYALQEVQFQPQVDDAIFVRPDEELDLRYYEEMMH